MEIAYQFLSLIKSYMYHSTSHHANCITQYHYIVTLHHTALQSLYYIILNYITQTVYITLHYITLHYITLHYLHYITLHYITLYYITLHCYITLHYITLHLNHPNASCYIILYYITSHSQVHLLRVDRVRGLSDVIQTGVYDREDLPVALSIGAEQLCILRVTCSVHILQVLHNEETVLVLRIAGK